MIRYLDMKLQSSKETIPIGNHIIKAKETRHNNAMMPFKQSSILLPHPQQAKTTDGVKKNTMHTFGELGKTSD